MIRSLTRFGVLATLAMPAFAQGSIAIPEPSDAILFVAAVVGLIIGRQSSRRPPVDPKA